MLGFLLQLKPRGWTTRSWLSQRQNRRGRARQRLSIQPAGNQKDGAEEMVCLGETPPGNWEPIQVALTEPIRTPVNNLLSCGVLGLQDAYSNLNFRKTMCCLTFCVRDSLSTFSHLVCSPNALSEGAGTSSWKFSPSLPCEWQEPKHLTQHSYLLGSALAGSCCSQELTL